LTPENYETQQTAVRLVGFVKKLTILHAICLYCWHTTEWI